MDKLQITVEVPVVVIVTENFKHKLIYDLQEKIRRVELELQQLDFTSRRTLMEAERQGQLPQVQRQIEAERQKRLDSRQECLDKIKQIARLKEGDEVLQGHAQSMVEVMVGDNWNEAKNLCIVLRDDRVVEIRRGQDNRG
ncbi:MAG TPA: YlqD family protein [Verrucomicrobiae bacterium]|nr:YlqD family protein [Verrucomicrobiae bacterium]